MNWFIFSTTKLNWLRPSWVGSELLVEWLKPELKGIPATVSEEDDNIYIRFQDLLICGVQVEEYNDIKVGDHIESYIMEEIKVADK